MKTLCELNHLIFVYLPPLWGKEIEQEQRFSFVFSEKDLTPYLPSCWWLVQSHRLVVSRVCFLHSFSEFLFIWNSQIFFGQDRHWFLAEIWTGTNMSYRKPVRLWSLYCLFDARHNKILLFHAKSSLSNKRNWSFKACS